MCCTLCTALNLLLMGSGPYFFGSFFFCVKREKESYMIAFIRMKWLQYNLKGISVLSKCISYYMGCI